MFEIKGTIKLVGDTETFGSSGFQKRKFVITTDHDKYPQDIEFELIKNDCAQADEMGIGQRITVSFDIRGREHKGRYYNNLHCWKFLLGEKARSPQAGGGGEEQDNIPF